MEFSKTEFALFMVRLFAFMEKQDPSLRANPEFLELREDLYKMIDESKEEMQAIIGKVKAQLFI